MYSYVVYCVALKPCDTYLHGVCIGAMNLDFSAFDNIGGVVATHF